MYRLPESAVRQWKMENGRAVARALATVCPQCREMVTFTPAWDANRTQGMPFPMQCPSCEQQSTLIRLGEEKRHTVRLFIDADEPARTPVAGIDDVPLDILPERLRGAYQSALNVLAIGEAEATAVTCRRVLEGITARILSDESAKRKTLALRIKALANEHEKLAAPLIELSEALRTSGNLGAHFDENGDPPTIEDAAMMVDLLDYLFTYLYVVPQQIHQFKAKVLGQAAEAAAVADGTE